MATPLHQDLALLLVDVQTGFLDVMAGPRAPLRGRLVRLARLARWLGLPTLATLEAPVSTKGGLPPWLAEVLPAEATTIAKAAFDGMAEAALPAALADLGRGTVAVAGAETDVCVLLTVEGLLAAGYRVQVIEDCLFTSAQSADVALARMRAAGAVPTTLKTLAFELTATVDRAAWPPAWHEGLAADPEAFPPPDDLGPTFAG